MLMHGCAGCSFAVYYFAFFCFCTFDGVVAIVILLLPFLHPFLVCVMAMTLVGDMIDHSLISSWHLVARLGGKANVNLLC